MLGRFLEYSAATADIQASLEFYARLGFSQAEVGEAWPHPYAVVTDGRIHLGLHQHAAAGPAVTFVKPDLLRHLGAIERLGVEFECRRLGNDVFNELAWRDPAGHRVRLLEARTFSPAKRAPTELSRCGYFLEIGLPCPDTGAAKVFWESMGFVGMEELEAALPRVSCTSDSVDIGLYDPASLAAPALVFDAGEVAKTLSALGEAGIAAADAAPPALRRRGGALLMAPEGTAIVLLPAADG